MTETKGEVLRRIHDRGNQWPEPRTARASRGRRIMPSILAVVVFASGAVAAGAPAATAGGRRVVHANDENELYKAVNNPNNAGTIVKLIARTYVLDAVRGGLKLQSGMTLSGDAQQSIIDAANVNGPFAISAGTKNVVEWLTVLNCDNVDGCIQIGTDQPEGWDHPAIGTVTNCVIQNGARRAIDILNIPGQQNSSVTITHNRIGGYPRQPWGFGIAVGNYFPDRPARITVTIRDNIIEHNRFGLYVADYDSSQNFVTVWSENNTYSRNEAGILVIAGHDWTASAGGSNNTVRFTSIDDEVSDNGGAGPPLEGITATGGIVLAGALGANPGIPSSHNTIYAKFLRTQFSGNFVEGNVPRNLTAYGAIADAVGPAGVGNLVELRLAMPFSDQTYPDFLIVDDEAPVMASSANPPNRVVVTPQ